MSYNIGDAVPLVYTITTPATVVLTITDPDGVTSTPSTSPSGAGPTTYTANVAVGKAGTWLYRFVATGAVTDAEDGQFYVQQAAAQDAYVTVVDVREQLGDSLTAPKLADALISRATRATSRAIDNYCGRRFWLDPTATAHTYPYCDPYVLLVDDIGSTSGLLVKTDTTGDGTFATTWAASDFQLEPLNTAVDGGGYAWWRIRAIAGKTFPYSVRGRPTVQVTARHGWAQIPEPVREAALLKAVKLFKRRESPDGFVGVADFGAVRVSRFEDPDVANLLNPYARPGFA